MSSSYDVLTTVPAADARAVVTVSKAGAGSVSSTCTTSRVAVNVANVTLLAANTLRKGASIYNNSAASNLFVKLGATASIGAGTESYQVRVVPGSYYEVPYGYNGIIDGIWDAADANGEALIGEYT